MLSGRSSRSFFQLAHERDNPDMSSKQPVPKAKPDRIAHRPFSSKAEQLMEKHLEAQYRDLAIPELVAALVPGKERADRSHTARRRFHAAET